MPKVYHLVPWFGNAVYVCDGRENPTSFRDFLLSVRNIQLHRGGYGCIFVQDITKNSNVNSKKRLMYLYVFLLII